MRAAQCVAQCVALVLSSAELVPRFGQSLRALAERLPIGVALLAQLSDTRGERVALLHQLLGVLFPSVVGLFVARALHLEHDLAGVQGQREPGVRFGVGLLRLRRQEAGASDRTGYLESHEQKRATARLLRAHGKSWAEVATELGYKNARAARMSCT